MSQAPDILTLLIQLLTNLRDIFLVVFGTFLGLLSAWIVGRRERKWARADQRRERIYGPLQDELGILSKDLPLNERTLEIGSEYRRIKGDHIRYMIPEHLRRRIIFLYEVLLPKYDHEKVMLENKYEDSIRAAILERLTPDLRTGSVLTDNSPDITTVANLGHCLLERRVPPHMEKNVESAFSVVKEHSRDIPEQTWQEFFQLWQERLPRDEDYVRFIGTRDWALKMTEMILNEINKDLEPEK